METNKIELKQIQTSSEVVTYLEGLVKGFKAGKIVIQQGDDFVSLVPAEQVEVEVEAKKKKNKEKFSIELSWHAAASSEPVTITTKEPVGAPLTAEKKTSVVKSGSPKIETNASASAKDKSVGGKDKSSFKK